jgi:Bacterial inner membrane protein
MRWIGCHGISGRLAIVPHAVDHAVSPCRQQPGLRTPLRAAGSLDRGGDDLAAIGLMRYPQLRIVYVASIRVMAAATFVTWQGAPSLLSATATALSIIGRMQGDERRLRLSLLASTPFWAGDVLVASFPGLIAWRPARRCCNGARPMGSSAHCRLGLAASSCGVA